MHVPRVLGLKYTHETVELLLSDCGSSLKVYMQSSEYRGLTPFQRACMMFDMIRQLIAPLKMLHNAGYTHADLKPDNICFKVIAAQSALPESFPRL